MRQGDVAAVDRSHAHIVPVGAPSFFTTFADPRRTSAFTANDDALRLLTVPSTSHPRARDNTQPDVELFPSVVPAGFPFTQPAADERFGTT